MVHEMQVYEARTQHPKRGFECLTQKAQAASTLWGVKHLPQNRDVFAVCAGDGTLSLYKYCYPDQRQIKDANGNPTGVAGTVELLSDKNLSSQPIAAFDWSPDKAGLFCCAAFDQCVRVGVVTKLQNL